MLSSNREDGRPTALTLSETDKGLLTEQVYAAIRRAILEFELQGGVALIESQLAQQLGVSKSPVREAILRLSAEGLVQRSSYRSCVVAELTRPELRDIYVVREELEPLAVKLATPRLDSDALEELCGLLKAADAALQRGDLVGLAECNSRFHLGFSRASGNHELYVISANLQARLTLSSVLGWRRAATMWDERREHWEIFDAVKEGDALRASDRMKQHVQTFRARFESDSSSE